MDESVISVEELLDGARSVSKGLETLRGEHEAFLSEVSDPTEEGDERDRLDKECKEAVLSESMNRLNYGLDDANLLSLVLQHFAALETQRDKLRAQVTRLCGENNWLRQELQKHQQQLSHTETELAKVVEEKQHLEYLLALPKQGSQLTEDETSVAFNDALDERHNEGDSEGDKGDLVGKEEESPAKMTSQDSAQIQKLYEYAKQHMQQGRHDVAVSLCKKAVQDLEQSHGKNHPDKANMLNILVVIYREQNKLREAIEVLNEVLAIKEKCFGRMHNSVATTLNNLSVLYSKLEEFRKAEPLCRRALEIRQKYLGGNHPDVAQQLINLASLCQNLGKYEEVEWYYQRALEIFETEYGPDDPKVSMTYNYLGKCYMKQGKLEAAEVVFKKVSNAVSDSTSREPSSSPTTWLAHDTLENERMKEREGVREKEQPRQRQIVTQVEPQRRHSHESPYQSKTSGAKPVGRSSLSSNVLRFFRWGSTGNVESQSK